MQCTVMQNRVLLNILALNIYHCGNIYGFNFIKFVNFEKETTLVEKDNLAGGTMHV